MRDLKEIAASIDGRFASLRTRLTNVEARTARVEEALHSIKTPFMATLPHLATKADLADVRTRLNRSCTACACDLAALAVLKQRAGAIVRLSTARLNGAGKCRNISRERTYHIQGLALRPPSAIVTFRSR